jgi:hypothetical protein
MAKTPTFIPLVIAHHLKQRKNRWSAKMSKAGARMETSKVLVITPCNCHKSLGHD